MADVAYANLLKHVCALGKSSGFPHFSIVNRFNPLLPRSAANPSQGILEVPVTN